MNMQLYLAHADDHRPVLAEGVPSSAAREAPARSGPLPDGGRRAGIAPPDDLSEQRWALIAPKGEAGDRLLELVAPLRRRREEQQGAEAVIYRVDPGMDPGAVITWANRDYWDAVKRRPELLPGYLLILGDADLVSWDLQQLVAADTFVGRLAFDNDEGYKAYVEKVLRWEQETLADDARAIFYAAQDGSMAMLEGHRHLLRPSVEIARARKEQGRFAASEIVEIGGERPPKELDLAASAGLMLSEAERASAGLLFSVSHGVGAPLKGWSSPGEQRAQQGALVLNQRGDRLVARDIESRPFLPGGVWFFFACFGAGTPKRSAYYPWLHRLHELGICNSADRVLSALPKGDDPPFVAALPKAALANPNGPLGVIGHVDLAWSWSFLDYDLLSSNPPQSRAERFQDMLRALVNGHRIGVAHHELTRFFRSISTALSSLYGEDARRCGADDKEQAARRAALWMQREDLCAHVLLGDPAARLPVRRLPAGV